MIIEKERFLFVLLLILVVGSSIADEFPVTEECSGNQILSELSDNELLLFLDGNGVTIPVGLADSRKEAMGIIRSFIIDIEQKPDIEFIYSLTQLHDLAYTLKSVVNGYYGRSADGLPE